MPARLRAFQSDLTISLVAIALQIEQRGQVVVVDGGAGRFRHHRLGVIGDAQARRLDHGQIVGAVAHRQGLAQIDVQAFATASSSACSLASRPRIGVADFAGQRRAVIQQGVAAFGMKARGFRHAAG